MDTGFDSQLRLVPVLAEAKDRAGSFEKLALEIAQAGDSQTSIDRRKLKNLVEGKNVALRVSELMALDDYLKPFGEGLATKPILQHSNILPSMSRAGHVTSLLGSYPRDEDRRIDISSWDIRSHTVLSKHLYQYEPNLRIELEEVLFNEGAARHSPANSNWRKLAGRDDRSLIFIGSPRVSHATEKALAQIFSVEAFKSPNLRTPRVPFYFIWPDTHQPFSSAFAVPADRADEIDQTLADEVRDTSKDTVGLYISGEDPYIVRRQSKRWNTYGIVAAQRRREGGIWLVICGVSGPATYGAARAVKSIADELPNETGENAPILWALVEVAVEVGNIKGDRRLVVDQNVIRTEVVPAS